MLHGTLNRRYGGEQLAGVLEDERHLCGFSAPSGSPEPLKKGGNRQGRPELDNQIQIADINSEFQRTGADNTCLPAGSKRGFGFPAVFGADCGVVDVHGGQPFSQRLDQPFGKASALDKDEGFSAADSVCCGIYAGEEVRVYAEGKCLFGGRRGYAD